MPCRTMDVGGGEYAIICSRGRRPRPCVYCGCPGSRLCDHALVDGKTCDRPLCRSCAAHVEPDTDYCREHAPQHGGA